MNIPFNNTLRIYDEYKIDIDQAIHEVLTGGIWLTGNFTQKFANNFAKYCDAKYCLTLANGTDALELSLRALIDPLDTVENEVITVANAGGYTSIACRLIGATPVYADIDIDTQLINIDSIINCLSPKVKVVVLTHLYGGTIDVLAVRKKLDNLGYNHVKIVEDCAQAHGAKVDQKIVGSIGDIGAFSFYPTKNLGAMGDAGAVITSDQNILKKVKELSQYGWHKKYHNELPFGRNSRMDEIQAAILDYLLKNLDTHNKMRKNIYNRYKNSSKLLKPIDNAQDFVAHLAVFRTENREDFIKYMSEHKIKTDIHYPVLDFEQKAWLNLNKRIDNRTDMENSKNSVKEIISLPCFPYMTEQETDYVCRILENWK